MKFAEIPMEGAIALVTGGARGIGLSIAQRLARAGVRVVIADLDGEAAARAAREIGSGAQGFALDVAEFDEYLRVVTEVEQTIGPIDIVVNNAGIMPVGPLLGELRGVAEATMRVNFWSHYISYQVLAPRMIARGRGHFINVTSAAGAIHSPGLASYVASKHAATGFARSAREELAGTGVTISTVMPAAVRTQLVDGIPFKWWEKLGIIPPGWVARDAVRTVRNRPAVVGSPRGTVLALRLQHLVPEWLWLLGRRVVDADRTVGPVDRRARSEYDGRIEQQVEATL
ncbi:SDR family NAD(P)-dependent oxidoreductase [Mycobacteroides salmoniphilum]|uniref:SDR family NAD(P)-dependent oxidoreductase n=1 Tax=Mycobacteroides salmoniphilum TaxID=404941 RepID=UPI001065A910|nr:SDR family NAD(P)-dependent oxidoreductase [Mycobacteroides salmoniphilum]TDZ75968.1 1-deoxy-11-beta-hydroxypentalenate dehydrogenase [Mycobacteroides salmoniphilum]TDZ84486.1 1-deoxy-11-beta-hydroxypentalenate dehydrogenase [Mycobacteroides salmoniphilum]